MRHLNPTTQPRPRRTSSANDVELALLRRVASRDLEAFEALFREYHGRLFRFLARLTSSAEMAEELFNDVMLVVWEKAATFRGKSRVSTWILGIAYRKGLKLLARERRRPRTSSFTDREDIARELASTEATQARHELQDWLEHGLRTLPSEQRLVMELAYLMGYSCREISQIAGCPVNTVKSRMFHARKKLKEQLPRLALARPAAHSERPS